ncbi:uncharacterized protein CIMG_03692 [Coccidioides immitis RS]|uniref:Large ribosomal subunit protein mL49 n=3 Tax=Coccidioides immitis TaxID=5501 RepID=J3KBY0_COCIM|nr:uncharacterized protein CIMG_03692 [Coccidioides immitis RS]EAS32668.3 hypothetical protein CIMG_03692 [Coccidioides immitis RS]KMP07916.1 hypothetical protein CIRG_07597 [Coccidioides immitis RMSCC 2394]KMU79048.1 hypothetical protein CISG_07355 [Coccidioides immitis RMSCC 3703]
MASVFSSTLSSPLRRTSSISSLHARSGSLLSSCQCSRAQLSQFHTHSSSIRSSARARSSSLLSFQSHQSRSITTRIPKPFSKSKSTLQGSTKSEHLPTEAAAPRPVLPLTNLPYFIRRTPSNQLPIYLVTKAGGTRQETKLQKTEGDVDALREDLIKALGMEKNPSDVTINRLNGHVIVKGWRKPEIQQFLLDRKF